MEGHWHRPFPVDGTLLVIRAAGILFATPDGRVLLMHRVAHKESDEGDRPGSPDVWAFPGGGIEGEETAEEAAHREVLEETGLDYQGPLTLWTRRVRDEVDFTTFLAQVDEFVPKLNEEHDAWNWAHINFALSSTQLHPGCRVSLQRFDMDELGVARAMAAGDLTSPQQYNKDLLLIALRITGTGVSFRPAHDEYVMRDPAIYMNQEFLDRCNGLPVILHHPEGTLLNTEEFRERIIGTIFLPFLRLDTQEVWGIAKIIDMEVGEVLKTELASTSPAVSVLGDKIDVPDGRKILIEDKPFLLDHLAVLIGTPGVWDKAGPLAGVESVDVGAEEDSTLDMIMRKVQLYTISQRI
jgi:8-oxo-dGTP pyrophosphatase MutT (NUDIX family)